MAEQGHRSRFGGVSLVGRVREHNEDAFAIRESLGLAVVCDGMGGHERGEVASELAVQTIVEVVESATSPVDADAAARLLAHAVEEANLRVHEAGGTAQSRLKMGTTVVTMWVAHGQAIVAHVGDSRCYRLRDGALQRLTADHTFLEDVRRFELGDVDDEMAQHFAHVLTRSVGQGPGCTIDLATCPVASGDRFLLCSDGLSGIIDDATIEAILSAPEPPDQAARRLGEVANERGGHDNITAVVAWIEPCSLRVP
jgi:PPM family protein phosphatase